MCLCKVTFLWNSFCIEHHFFNSAWNVILEVCVCAPCLTTQQWILISHLWTHCVRCCYWFLVDFFCCGYLCRSIFFLHWAIYLSHSHSHTFSMSCERYSVSIVIIIPNTTCNVCFFFIRFTVKIHTFRKPKKQQQMNGFPLSRPVEHHSLTKTWKLPKTFPRCNNCHVQYPFLPSLWLLSFSLSIVLICRVISRSLALSLSQSFVTSYSIILFYIRCMIFPLHNAACLTKSLHLHENDITLHYQWHTLVAHFGAEKKKRQHERIWHRQQHQQTFQ